MGRLDFAQNLKNQLNPAQYEAVTHPQGPLLIFAGAGSGKTRVLTYRIAHLVEALGVDPYNILAVTFTNKAAGEMKQRLEKLLGRQFQGLWVSTFHSLCARILRFDGEVLGYKKNFSIYDQDDSLSLIKRCYKELGMQDANPAPGICAVKISRAKDRLIYPDEYRSSASNLIERNVARVYERYQEELLASNALDFDDLIMKAVELFRKFSEILDKYRQRFLHILVDEYQDTNHAQYVLVNLLAAEHKNLCVVGDDDQSIYGWRGADISNILNFEKDFPGAKVVRLEQNYRSTQSILTAASAVVVKNVGRSPKKLWTQGEVGEKLTVLPTEDESREATAVVEKISGLRSTDFLKLSDFVILYRTNAQSRSLEEVLRRTGIPYEIVGGVRFYERMEIKDILAYLRVIVNPSDTVSLLRIINVPKRGIGPQTISKLQKWADAENISLYEALILSEESPELSQNVKKKLADFGKLTESFKKKAGELSPEKLASEVIEKTDYIHHLEEAFPREEAESRIDNVKELVSAMQEFSERSESPTLEAFLEEVSLLTDIDRWDSESDKVTLMTLHSAKGLEFPVVFITGLEEGLFPLSRCMESREELEEERRLFYVGLTRAKERVFLSYAFRRRRFDDVGSLRSQFLEEIPQELVQEEKPERLAEVYSRQELKKYAAAEQLLEIGIRVYHDSFGVGKIIEKKGAGENLTVTVLFEGYLKKKIMVKYANMEILGH
ncbi:MAG: ATP-dependent helicase [Candidatus Zixiibacteriota bacterium]